MHHYFSKPWMGLASLAVTTLLVTGAGCMSTNADTATANLNTTTVPVDNSNTVTNTNAVATNTAASITIVSPDDGETVEPQFDVAVEIAGLELAPDEVEGANVAGHGHYHLWIDGEYYAAGTEDNVRVTDLAVGEHEVMVSLQNNDHSDLATPVKSTPIKVTVVAAAD